MATKIVIEHLSGSRAGQRQELEPQPRVRFGRHPDNEVAFDAHKDLDASTRHAELRLDDGRWLLLDVGSSNGTLLAGKKIARVEVSPGVPLEIEFGTGGPRLWLFVGDPEQARLGARTPPRRAGSKAEPAPAEARSVSGNADGAADAVVVGGATTSGDPPGPAEPRTLATMVHSARELARAERGLARPTRFVRSLVDQALHRSTQRFRMTLLVMAALVLAALAGFILWQVRQSRGSAAARVAPTRLEGEEFKDRVPVAESLSGYNVAIRSDLVGGTMRAKGVQGAP